MSASSEVVGNNRRNSFDEKQGTPIKIRRITSPSRKPPPKKPQQLRRVKLISLTFILKHVISVD
jgi:hypothetical protein